MAKSLDSRSRKILGLLWSIGTVSLVWWSWWRQQRQLPNDEVFDRFRWNAGDWAIQVFAAAWLALGALLVLYVITKVVLYVITKAISWFAGHSEATPVSVAHLADELSRLAGLRDAGILSDEEFAKAKAIALGEG